MRQSLQFIPGVPCLAPTFLSLVLLPAVLLAGFTADASAQDPSELRAVYGRGVHAFFAGSLTEAEQLFSQVIDSGSQDPRAYYYRAMIYLKTGRKFQAEYDMRVGSTFEAQNPGSRYLVGKSLQRVQGEGRRMLERFRRQARLDRVQQFRSRASQRYEQLKNRESTVLYKDEPVRLDSLVGPQELTVSPTTDAVVPPVEITPEPVIQETQQPEVVDEDDSFDFEGFEEEPAADEMPMEMEEEDVEEDDDFFSEDSGEMTEEEGFVTEAEAIVVSSPATSGTAASTGGSLFYQIGYWMTQPGSRGQFTRSLNPTMDDSEFELGPTEDGFPVAEQDGGEPVDPDSFDDDFFGTEEETTDSSVEDDEDPFEF